MISFINRFKQEKADKKTNRQTQNNKAKTEHAPSLQLLIKIFTGHARQNIIQSKNSVWPQSDLS